MDSSPWFLFFHFIGLGLIMTLLVTGWVLTLQYGKTEDYKTKLVILSSMKRVGLLSPLAILVILLSGIGNMHVRGLGFFTESSETWLNIKILLFAAAAINGVIFGIRSKKRGMLVAQFAQGSAPADGTAKLAGMDKGALIFHVVQTILLISILVLAVWKPGRFAA